MKYCKKKHLFFSLFLFTLAACGFPYAGDSPPAQSKKPVLQVFETSHDLGVIQKGTEFGHEFLFENFGEAPLKLIKASSKTAGEIQVRMPKEIPAGGDGFVHISLDSNRILGGHALEIVIKTNDPDQPEVLLTLNGYVQWPVEILPRPLVAMKVQKGQSAKRELTLVNHTNRSLEIKKIEFDKNLFQVKISELEKGKKFKLTVSSRESAPLGEQRKQILFRTNIPECPVVGMAAWIKVLDRIYTNLQELDFGERFLADISNPKVVDMTAEIVIINGMSTPGFKVLKAECDIDFLVADLHPIATNGVHRVDVYFQPEKAKKGAFQGSLTILTNDEQFKQIVIPVRGELY